MKNNLDKQYIELLQDILDNGVRKEGRNGATYSVFGRTIRHDMSEGFPLLTLRPIYFRIAFEEMKFFLAGKTNSKELEEKNINIWKGNTSREFLDNKGLSHLPEGDMGKGYGWQMRSFGGTTIENGYDQIQELLFNLKHNPNSRRHIVSHWNPLQLDDTALPPCHLYHQYYVANNKLSSMVLMRSWDFYHGAPYNLSGYAFILTAFAKLLNYEVGDLLFHGNDVHIYDSQLEVSKKLSSRESKCELPKINIKKELNSLEDILDLDFYDDIEILDYNHGEKLEKIPMTI